MNKKNIIISCGFSAIRKKLNVIPQTLNKSQLNKVQSIPSIYQGNSMEILGNNKDDNFFKNKRTIKVEQNVDLRTSRRHVKTETIEKSSDQNEEHEIIEHFSIKNETDDLILEGADELTFGDYEIVSSTDFGKGELRGINYDGAKGLTFEDYECIPIQMVSNRDVLVKTETVDQYEARENTKDLFKKCNDELTFGDFEFVPTHDFGKNVMREIDCDGTEESFFVDNGPLNVKTEKTEKSMHQNTAREIIKDVSFKIEPKDPLSQAPSDRDEIILGDNENIATNFEKDVLREMNCDGAIKQTYVEYSEALIVPSEGMLNCFIPMKRNVILKGNENKNFLEKCKEKMNELIEQRKQQEKEMEAEALARRAAKNKSKQKRLQMNKTAQTQARLTSGEFEIVPTKDSGKNVLKRIDCDEVKELPCCDNEQFTTNEESRRDRKLRLNRERKRRWLSRQSEEKLAALRAQDARAARKRRQEKVKLLQQMEINSTKGLND